MKHLLAGALAVTIGIAGSAFAARADDTPMKSTGARIRSMGPMATHTIALKAQNGSGETGTAMLAQHGDALMVKLAMTGGGSAAQPAHIHKGTCAHLDPTPAYPLATISDGTSLTTLKGVTMAHLTSGHYAINVHKSTADLKTYVACGDITH